MQITVFIILVSYLLGSIPFGLLFAKLLGKKDLRTHGSGNIGATNAMRVGGKRLGVLTLIFDALKGVVAVSIALTYTPIMNRELLSYVAWFFVVFGHIFPIWLKFKGGKGVATFIAASCMLPPFITGFFTIIIWVCVYNTCGISAIASIFAILFSGVFILMQYEDALYINVIIAALVVLILYRHISNIKRIVAEKV